MPGKVKVKVLAGRNLPVMDRASDTSDAYVEIKLGNTTCKTDVYRKSLHPQWNSEWFKFEMDDEELQDEPLHIRVMDYDTYSANDAIGKVYVDLNPLLLCRETSSVMSGWIPIYDTMHGIRGEVNVIIKVELFSDLNRFRESSCGVKFFYGPGIPSGFRVQSICGFVEELVVNEDPEYQWIDKIRTPRASNEARQTLFSKLSGEVQRKIGLKALELGGNAIIGYKQCFDLEGESGLVVRGLGTAINITYSPDACLHASSPTKDLAAGTPSVIDDSLAPPSSPTFKLSMSPARCNLGLQLHRPADNDAVSSVRHQRTTKHPQKSLDMLEYPFLSMTQFPAGFIVHLGGVVSARSVKLLGRTTNPDEQETRDTWWTELRMEIRAHARALGCNIVLGYSETTSITDDVCLLSANGTAAVVNLHWWNTGKTQADAVENKTDSEVQAKPSEGIEDGQQQQQQPQCITCHIPYSESSVPFPVSLVKCSVCKKARVPDILFNTIQIPAGILSTGRGCLVQARVCRLKKDAKGELNAKEISDSLPFLEYELHRQLLNKLKVKGMNALFGLRVQISVGAKMMLATATATGIFLTPLPPPLIPKISSGKVSEDDLRIAGVQRWIHDTVHRNREIYGIRISDLKKEKMTVDKSEELLSAEDELPDLDLSSGNKDACVLEIDDSEDVDIISLLIDQTVPDGFDLFNTETIPGLDNIVCNLQMFIQVWRMKIPATGLSTRHFSQMCENVIQSLFFKLRRMMPCALCNLQFFVDLAEDEEVQIITLGNTVGLGDPAKSIQDELEHNDNEKVASIMEVPPKKFKYHVAAMHHGIDITSSSNIPGSKIEKYLGNLNFFLIRECTTLREIGGLSGFAQGFVAEALAIVRAHVAALGGNALVAFFMNQCVLLHNPHKNQAQCLISIGGDAVRVENNKIIAS